MSNGRYLFGIVDCAEPKSLGALGHGEPPAEVIFVPCGSLAAVVGDAKEEYSVPEREDVLAHQKVLEKVMEEYTVLPVRFGTVAPGDAEIRELLRTYDDVLLQEMDRLRGKMEVGLKSFWKKETVLHEVEAKVGKVASLKAGGNEKKAYEAALKVGRAVQEMVEQWQERYVPAIMKRLETCAETSRLNEVIGVQMLFNASFLIKESARKKFEEELDKISNEYAEKLNFRFVAPLPPYNFVQLNLVLPWER